MPPLRARRARSPPSPFPRRAAAPAARRLPRANWAPPAPVRAGGSPGARRRLARPTIPGRGARHRRSPRPGSRPLPRGGAVPAGAVEPQACRRGSPPLPKGPPVVPPAHPTSPRAPRPLALAAVSPARVRWTWFASTHTLRPSLEEVFLNMQLCAKKNFWGKGLTMGVGRARCFCPYKVGHPRRTKVSVGGT